MPSSSNNIRRLKKRVNMIKKISARLHIFFDNAQRKLNKNAGQLKPRFIALYPRTGSYKISNKSMAEAYFPFSKHARKISLYLYHVTANHQFEREPELMRPAPGKRGGK
jgi:hypothetical protein